MTKYFTLNRNYQDIKIAVSAGEVHIIPVLATGEMDERLIIPNDSRASWYIGNRFFETGQGEEVYTQDSLGGQISIFKHVREVASSVLFTSTGKLVSTAAINSRAIPQWYSPVFGSAAA